MKPQNISRGPLRLRVEGFSNASHLEIRRRLLGERFREAELTLEDTVLQPPGLSRRSRLRGHGVRINPQPVEHRMVDRTPESAADLHVEPVVPEKQLNCNYPEDDIISDITLCGSPLTAGITFLPELHLLALILALAVSRGDLEPYLALPAATGRMPKRRPCAVAQRALLAATATATTAVCHGLAALSAQLRTPGAETSGSGYQVLASPLQPVLATSPFMPAPLVWLDAAQSDPSAGESEPGAAPS
eukprot:CAMPEP_0170584046 /NCGR_PEP_ID=MMETSP0224-20130122/8481_1 /TAXON_ID=285029 /ORGANISM="Togula jolla, Strain CCCM 725" /LENGTH=245 /DNA_ID=CAMNT_0010907457 /DNA_START=520 /DNA_END=1254 /DNA_ORIENTATION=-